MSRLYFLAVLLLAFSCKQDKKQFTLLSASDTGIHFNNFIDEDAENNVLLYGYFYNGGGVAAADFNNDGLVDLYFTGNMVANKLYLNKGEMQFDDISEKAGVGLNLGWKTGVSLVDINDDGWIDIYVCRAGAQDPNLRRNLLYVNNGKTSDGIPAFTEKAAAYGLDDPSYTTQAVFFDYDKDGDTDCFLLNHSVQQYAGFSNLIGSYRSQRNDAYGNKLLRNDNGRFVNQTDSAGIISNVLSFGLGVNINDFNNDGWQDIYIANDYNENDYLYLNKRDGTFKEVIRDATGHVSLYSMGTDAADLNNDGRMDILTLDMLPASNERIKLTSGDDNYDKYQQLLRAGFHEQTMRNMLQLNNGVDENGTPVFSEIGQLAGISNTDWSWSALAADFDNDGWKDIFISNGYARDYTNMEFLKYSADLRMKSGEGGKEPTQMDIIGKMPPINEPNYIFKNERNLTFSQKVDDWGFSEKGQSNGAIYADLDNDGDLDLVTNNVGKKAFVYRNNAETKSKGTFLKVKLDEASYAEKAGAVVHLYVNDSLYQVQNFMPVRGFQSSQWDLMHFGLGNQGKADSLKIIWAGGKTQTIKNLKANEVVSLKISEAQNSSPTELNPVPALWEKTAGISFKHTEDAVNDFRVQTLLPYMLSYAGPHMAQADLNGDGTDDFYIAGGKGQSGGLFLSAKGGTWRQTPSETFAKDSGYEDSTPVFFDADGDGDQDLLVGSQGYSLNPADPLQFSRLYINERGKWRLGMLPATPANVGAVAIADADHDGDLDVFMGSRVTPGRFPESTGGVLLLNNGKGDFMNATASAAPGLPGLGMITDAVWEDLNGDRYPELLLTTDWGPVQIFENNKGVLENVTPIRGDVSLNGCWNVIRKADLDGDGDMDFVVGNMGKNWQWNVTSPAGISLYAADYDHLGRIVPVVSIVEKGKEYPYASRDELLDQTPSLKKVYTDYIKYSNATLAEIFPKEKLGAAKVLHASEWRSGVLENRNGKFTFHGLPTEAQFAPVYAVAFEDVNKDGKTDIILGGNASHTRVRIGKSEANLLQVFVNRGGLHFDYLPQAKSGFFVKGDVRSLAALSSGKDKILIVGINNEPLIMFGLRR